MKIERNQMTNKSNILIYQNENANTKVDVLFEDSSVWPSQSQLCEMFQRCVRI